MRGVTADVVIVTYNGEAVIDLALRSVVGHQSVGQILVCDNGSTDGTLAKVEERRRVGGNISVLRQSRNVGFGRGHEQAFALLAEQMARYVLLLNQDAFLPDDVLTELLRLAEQMPEFGILSPVHLANPDGPLERLFADYSMAPVIAEYVADACLGKTKPVYSTHFVPAAIWLIRGEVISALGGFNPCFYQYGEDENFCQRVRRGGWMVGICSGIAAVHSRDGEPTSKQTSAEYRHRVRAGYLRELLDVDKEFRGQALRLPLRVLRRFLDLLLARRVSDALFELVCLAEVIPRIPALRGAWSKDRAAAEAARALRAGGAP